MKSKAVTFLLVLALCLQSSAASGLDLPDFLSSLIKKIPSRPYFAMTGSGFAKSVFGMDESDREQAILTQITKGNLPDFLRKLKPVQLIYRSEDEKTTTATVFVMPDYLAIGSDRDFLSIPMALRAATEIANRFGFILPTKKMVDAIFEQSAFHLVPQPMAPGPRMRSTDYYLRHDRKIKQQRETLYCSVDALISGHKKDVVLTNRLAAQGARIAIYGWHRLSGIPIQPLSTIHSASYADYSHGIRLVSDIALIDGEPWSIYRILENPWLARLLSDEGPIRKAREIMTLRYLQPPPPVTLSKAQENFNPDK